MGELLSHNGYAYCMNNPVNMVDENGNEPISIGIGIGIAILFLGVATILSIPKETYTEALNVATNAITTVSNSLSNIREKTTNAMKTATITGVATIAQAHLKSKDKPQSNYWKAELKNGEVSIGEPISYTKAVIRVALKKDIMCKNEMYAYLVASQFNGVLGPEKDINQKTGRVYYNHYHINNKHGSPHIWFY